MLWLYQIQADLRVVPTAGLGAFSDEKHSLDNISQTSHSRNWAMARRRYNQLIDTKIAERSGGVAVKEGCDPQQVSKLQPTENNLERRGVTQTSVARISWMKSQEPLVPLKSVLPQEISDED